MPGDGCARPAMPWAPTPEFGVCVASMPGSGGFQEPGKGNKPSWLVPTWHFGGSLISGARALSLNTLRTHPVGKEEHFHLSFGGIAAILWSKLLSRCFLPPGPFCCQILFAARSFLPPGAPLDCSRPSQGSVGAPGLALPVAAAPHSQGQQEGQRDKGPSLSPGF